MKKLSKKGTKNQSKNPLKISDLFKKVEEKNLRNNKIARVTDSVLVNTVVLDCDSDVEIEGIDEYRSDQIETEVSMKRRIDSALCNENNESKSPKRNRVVPAASTSSKSRSPLRQIELLSLKKIKNVPRTPEKTDSVSYSRKTPPVKLFKRTPQKVQDFNVEVIENFVKVTPSKCGVSLENKNSSVSSGKTQASLLKYLSPSTSNRSVEAQEFNERTPKKDSNDGCPCTPTTKVKMKLYFGDQNVPEINEKKLSTSRELPEKRMSCNDEEIANMLDQNSLDEFCLSQFVTADFKNDNDCNKINDLRNTLDLSRSKHCEIVKIEISPSHWKLTVKSTSSEECAVCQLKDFWLNTKLDKGDIIHITAKKIGSEWIIDNNNGLIVYEPDLLISSTSVVNSLYCKRKKVLSEKFHGFEPTNELMVIGTLVHYILQETLKKKLHTIEQIKEILESVIIEKETIKRLYESGQSIQELKTKLSNYLPRVLEFVESYLQDKNKNGRKPPSDKNCWHGSIDIVEDIEENIWCPELGIKGKVDVSIRSKNQLMPLEMKTGKASFSIEHRGQVLLYIMMMNKMGFKVSSGLLLYLRDGILKEIPMAENEKRDIMILRNELAYYLKRRPKVIYPNVDKSKKYILPSELPEPINHHSACRSCPYNVICTAFSEFNKEDLSSNKSLKKVKEEVLSHLEEEHLNYFIHWSSLINLEEFSSNFTSKPVQEIYTKLPAKREAEGRCISFLKISEILDECNGIMDHTFVKDDNMTFNFFSSGIDEGNYAVVSTDDRSAVASGFVTHVDAHSITIALDRNLRSKHPFKHFHVDTYESSMSHAFNQTSLTLLLKPSARADQLRRIIIDKRPPTFLAKLPKVVAVKGIPILKRLNKVQQRAVLKAVAANDFLLIKGMPGTGKTSTIVALIQLLTQLEKSVLITSHTHSAVDNVCEKLLKLNVDFLRLGSPAKISESLRSHSELYRTKDCKTPEELAQVYNQVKVIASTCLGSGHPVLSKRIIDVCIVDESTQVLQTTLIRPIYAAKTFILIGDPEQLPPVVRNTEALEMGMAISLFHRLHSEESTISLNLNYRMNKTITELANSLTYNGELLVANDSVGEATLNIPNKEVFASYCKNSKWIADILDSNLQNSVHLIDTGPTWNLDFEVSWSLKNINNQEKKKSLFNIFEAAVVANLINALLKGGVQAENIGVIAAFACQVKQLSFLLNQNIDVSTVDQFQGRDKNVIIYSCTKSLNLNEQATKSKFEILEDHRRLTVAVTRAKNKLILVGDMNTMKRYTPFSKLLYSVKETHITKLEQNVDDFSWCSVLKNVKA